MFVLVLSEAVLVIVIVLRPQGGHSKTITTAEVGFDYEYEHRPTG